MLTKTLSLALVLISTSSFAAEIDGINFSETQKLGTKDLVLNGVGLRQATIFKIKAYAGALYLEKKNSNGEAISKSPEDKIIVMNFLREVDQKKIKETYLESFENNCETNCAAVKPAFEQMIASFSDMKKADILKFEFSGKKLTAFQNGVQKFQTEVPDYQEAILKLYLGKKPTDKDLQKGLLGL
ncbi:MAG: chalcone isomerase family protein [Bacteriovoracaceae bacterium]